MEQALECDPPEAVRSERASSALALQEVLDRFDHDVRTPLGTMAAALELLHHHDAGSPGHDQAMAVLSRQIGRVHLLTDTLREFSRTLVC